VADGEYLFTLFVSGGDPNSLLAEENLRAICQEHLPNRHRIEVVDVVEDFETALKAQIMVAPAVVLAGPRSVTLYGTLADKAKVITALALDGADHGR
jgi:circadian clock protein KaiB